MKEPRDRYAAHRAVDERDEEPVLMKVRSAMRISTLSRPTIYALIEAGAFKAVMFKGTPGQSGGTWLIERASFMRWLQSLTEVAKKELAA